ncbi:glycosyltransferase [Pedobacter namyangjuensis]|uniref:glycosyltransferase n=1 Tax=Pedobacter namyangjuensis TaxID=600626 RepID=UPI000DE529FD|nr:glycosyltransferase [Pedobacter namyangjuensis]
MQNRFSVLLSLYDGEVESHLEQALHSLWIQKLKPDQVVIVFDGILRNGLVTIVNSFLNKLNDLTIIKLESNIGLGRALNIGLKHCRYELVARMDTDDICYIDRFEKQINHMILYPEIAVLGCSVQEFNTMPNDLGLYRHLPINMCQILTFAKFRNPLNHPSVVFRKTKIAIVGSYVDMPLFEDYFLWIRVLEQGLTIENLSDALLHFRVGNDMIGRRHGLSYLKKEVNFLKEIKKRKFINDTQFFLSLITKAPLRLMPKFMLRVFYKKILR